VDGPRGALGAYLMMKRGCRVGLVVAPRGETFARDVLARYDPAVRLTPAPAAVEEWPAALGSLAEELHADGVVLPLAVDDYPGVLGRWGDRVIFSPTVGLTEPEVEERWQSVAERAS